MLMWEAIQDATLIMLIIAAFISLGLSFLPTAEGKYKAKKEKITKQLNKTGWERGGIKNIHLKIN